MKRRIYFLTILVFLAWPLAYVQAQGEAAVPLEAKALENTFVNVAASVGKAVVSVSTESTEQAPERFYFRGPGGKKPFAEDDFFRNFFEDFFGEMPGFDYQQHRVGLGSGVIIDPDGFILTNEHVVGKADKITVKLADGREFKGQVKGTDSRADLAVVKINAKNLPAVKLGNSDNLKIGQWAIAVGNPFGFVMDNSEPTVTVGVISALHRSLGRLFQRGRDYGDLIQTDAAINPGNSGGPLVNLEGEVVGINVAIFTTSGGYEGVGFAIPVNNVKRIISRLIEGKKIVYGWLGITVQDLDENLAKYFGLADKNGVLVTKVLEGGPAEKAGVKNSDVIKKFDNKPVNSVKELLSLVGSSEAGKKVRMAVIRDKREVALDIVIGQRPETAEEGLEEGLEEEGVPSKLWRGIEVQELNAALSRRYDLEKQTGVLVTDVKPGSPADDAGIAPGDVILEINKTTVKSVEDYNKLTSAAKGDVLVKTNRGYAVVKSEQHS
ncbi:MAG: Do family serine endopeptidase [Candidatus Omnitrophica bacterium]|nr:Do family serine endopeptidase [Candidatus Omnitrophota bacterium]MDD5236546.1 Do family serine endopeptidase [Candidatus Omnitrophota bacterium]MDD5611087.1 Do family serine endopeptidase [Candidatus Omnitrophota bacterium]